MRFLRVYVICLSHTYCICIYAEDELYKNPQGQITQVVGDRSLYPSKNRNWTSCVDFLFMYRYRVWVGSRQALPK